MDWIREIDNAWVAANLNDLNRVHESMGPYLWDAQGFSGILSFAECCTNLKRHPEMANPAMDTAFLRDKDLIPKLVFAMQDMLSNERLHADLEEAWPKWENQIHELLSRLQGLRQ